MRLRMAIALSRNWDFIVTDNRNIPAGIHQWYSLGDLRDDFLMSRRFGSTTFLGRRVTRRCVIQPRLAVCLISSTICPGLRLAEFGRGHVTRQQTDRVLPGRRL